MENGKKETQKKITNIQNEHGVWRGIVEPCTNLLRSPVYVFTILACICAASSQISVVLFSPKYLEVNFGMSASKANYIIGLAVLPCSVIGTLTSGFILRRWKLERKGSLRLLLSCMTCAALCGLVLLCLGCDSIDIRGVTASYAGQDERNSAKTETAPCNQQCGCELGSFSPVCGEDGVTYLTSCHAGCSDVASQARDAGQSPQGSKNYSKCACVGVSGNGKAVSGKCSLSNCPNLLTAVIFFEALGIFASAMVTTPAMIVILRTVPPEDKPVGIGVSTFLVRCVGFIPSQVILAAIIDTTCIYWSAGNCDKGFCKIYDNYMFRTRMFGMLVCYQLPAVLSIFVASVFDWRERVKNKIG